MRLQIFNASRESAKNDFLVDNMAEKPLHEGNWRTKKASKYGTVTGSSKENYSSPNLDIVLLLMPLESEKANLFFY